MRRSIVLIGVLGLILSACTTGSTSTSTVTEQPQPTTSPIPTTAPSSTATTKTELEASDQSDVVFVNGTVITMNRSQPTAEAVAVRGGEIFLVGDGEHALASAGPDTLVIDLAGRALLPGFVDAHNHALGFGAESSEQMEEAQQYLLSSGVTTIGDTAVGHMIVERLSQADEQGTLKIRTSVYPVYNTKCDGPLQEDWFLRYPPMLEESEMLRFPGIKIFSDSAGNLGAPCGWAAMSVELPPDFAGRVGSGPFGESLLTAEQMAEVIETNQERGYQIVIHARGDVTVENAITAIEIALDGQPNTFRHRVDHNDFIRPDQIPRYGEIGVVPLVRGRPSACTVNDDGGIHRFGEEVQPWFFVIRSLIDANPGLPVAWHSDMAFPRSRRPAVDDLFDLVTRSAINEADGSVCEPPDWLAAERVETEEALRLMTINGAHALFMDDKVGSIEEGKFADLIVLSQDPLQTDPSELTLLQVEMTMVGGQIEYCTLGEACE